MLQARLTKFSRILLLLVFSFLFFIPRVIFLDRDEVNPDAVNWHYRSEQFIVGLKYGNFLKTYQHYHPGVTLMWIVGPIVEITKHSAPDLKIYNQFNFQTFHFYAKLGLISVQFVLSILALWQLSQHIGKLKSFGVMSLLSIEPFFLGNSRLLHMDTLLTLFIFNALLFSYKNLKNPTVLLSIISGIFLALSFLTKSIAIGATIFVVLLNFLAMPRKKDFFKFTGIVLTSFMFFTVLLFPALWVSPLKTILSIFNEAERVGIRKGHEQIMFGKSTNNGGFLFYPLILLMKVSPITLFSALFFLVYQIKRCFILHPRASSLIKEINIVTYLAIFYVGYLSFMFIPSKKLDRYMVIIYPFLCLISALGLIKILSFVRNKYARYLTGIFLLIGLFYPVFTYFPYYFTYTSPLLGSAEDANKIIAQKPFGIGMFELKNILIEYYNLPLIGFYDTKPMKAIYANSMVFDVRISSPDEYDLFVLGPDEEVPTKVLESKHVFKKDKSIFINGLEYWRIYVKKI